MRLPTGVNRTDEKRQRRKKIDRIKAEAERRGNAHQALPDLRPGKSPKVIATVVVVMLGLLGLFINHSRTVEQEQPSQTARLQAMKKAQNDLRVLSIALGRFKFHVGHYPSEPDGLHTLVDGRHIPGWKGPYIRVLRPDSWNSPYWYALSNGVPIVASPGPDALPRTADDFYANRADLDVGTDWTNGWTRSYINFGGSFKPPPQ